MNQLRQKIKNQITSISRKQGIIIIGILVLVLIITAVILSTRVKVTHKSPEGVVKSLINAYQKDSEKAVRDCYGFSKKENLDTISEKEINSNLNYFKAHNAKQVIFDTCDSLGTFNGYELVYIIYQYDIQLSDLKEKKENSEKEESKKEKESNKLRAPAISLYFVQNKDEKYYVVPAKDIDAELSDISKREYTKFVTTDIYKKYQENYNTFIKEHPDYEELVSKSLKKIKDGSN
jgi:hypothetical protein